MKLYSSKIGTNPQVAHVICGVKGIEIERVEIDMATAENRKADYLKINPTGTLPCLITDEGFVLSEVTAIAEYLEELKPDPVLCGASALERAETRMWARRTDFMITIPMAQGFRNGEGAKFFEGRVKLYPEISDSMKDMAANGLRWLDTQMKGKKYLCGDRFTYADIVFYCHAGFFSKLGQPIDPKLANVTAYFARMEQHETLAQHSAF